MRIDKWLWAARFFKTRRLSVEALNKGHIHINGVKPKAARLVAFDDELMVKRGNEIYEVTVLQLIETRGPAKIAQTMYKESEESIKNRETARDLHKLMASPKPDKAPDKRERRDLRKLSQQS